MLVSVIIPCYNSEKYLKDCLNSVICQTYANIEILVIDDGSFDDTSKIVGSFADDRIKYFYKENGGHCSARNYGIRQSNDAFIAFLDSDDLWENRKIEKQMNH